jgi:NADH-quinone oxidoreductase subunit J
MTVQIALFIALAAVAIVAAIGLLRAKNAVYAALCLVSNFGVVAVMYILLGAPFLAMVQITVYAGAIMVLFVFVIMLLGAEHLEHEDHLLLQGPLGWVLGLGLAGLVTFAAVSANLSAPAELPAEVSASFGAPGSIGHLLFTEYVFPFEVISFLLLAAMVGAVVLTLVQREKKARRSLRNPQQS